jgi:hypothetical protein
MIITQSEQKGLLWWNIVSLGICLPPRNITESPTEFTSGSLKCLSSHHVHEEQNLKVTMTDSKVITLHILCWVSNISEGASSSSVSDEDHYIIIRKLLGYVFNKQWGTDLKNILDQNYWTHMCNGTPFNIPQLKVSPHLIINFKNSKSKVPC